MKRNLHAIKKWCAELERWVKKVSASKTEVLNKAKKHKGLEIFKEKQRLKLVANLKYLGVNSNEENLQVEK